MKKLITAASLAILLAGQAQAQNFRPNATPEQVGKCVANLEVAGFWVENEVIGDSARSAAAAWLRSQPDQSQEGLNKAALAFMTSKQVELSLFVGMLFMTGTDSFSDLQDARNRLGVFAMANDRCLAVMGMTPADYWPELGQLRNTF